jgi:hypothetical protein
MSLSRQCRGRSSRSPRRRRRGGLRVVIWQDDEQRGALEGSAGRTVAGRGCAAHQSRAQVGRLSSSDYLWDKSADVLDQICREILGTAVSMTPARSLAVFYTARVKDRTAALRKLFAGGHYVPAMPLVRVAYEDWLSAGTALLPRGDGSDPDPEFLDDVAAEYVRLYRRFLALCGKRAANRESSPHPEYALAGLSQKADPPYAQRDWRRKAVDLGLETIHDVAYGHLSNLSHGSLHAISEYVAVDGNRFYEKQVERDAAREELPALWVHWFQLRALTIAGHAWGRDYEHVSDAWLAELPSSRGRTLATCVFRRERWAGPA